MFKRFAYLFIAILYFVFFISIACLEKVDIYSARTFTSHNVISDITSETIEDSEAPIGKKIEYRFTIKNVEDADNCLAFYLIHQYVDVYFDNTLVYSLSSEDDALLGKSITCNWAMIPIIQEDIGAEVRIVLSPMFRAVENRSVEFLFGSRYDIFVKCLVAELPEFILSCLCVILGIGILIVQFVNRKQNYLDIFYLGMLSLSIGLWKLSDIRITPMLLPEYSKGIGYIALGMVPIISLTLLLYTKQVFLNAKTRVLNAVTLFVMLYDIVVLVLHLIKIFDFRQSLTITLIGLALVVILVLLTTYWNRHYLNVSAHSKITKFFVMGLTVGLSLDLLLFFTSYGNASLVCSLIIFILYAISIFFSHILQMTRKVHTDPLTGLLNRQNWNEAVVESLAAKNSTTIIVLDLNSLKQINDTYGHDVGDHLIAGFATILKNSFPTRCSICRWGGDEFAIMLQDMTNEQIEHILSTVEISVNTYNNTTTGPEMSYSAGYANSSEYSSVSADFLFKEADKKMYRMKQEWHRSHQK